MNIVLKTIKMEATKNVPSAHHSLKLMKEFSLVTKIHSIREISKGEHGERK